MCIFACLLNARKQRGGISISNQKNKTEYFTRFPNEYIQGNIKTKYGEAENSISLISLSISIVLMKTTVGLPFAKS